MRFFPRDIGKVAFFDGFSLKKAIFPISRGNNRFSQGVENRGSLIGVPLALRVLSQTPDSHGFQSKWFSGELRACLPRGPKDQKNSRFRAGLKISSENEIFERATHRGPIFCGEIETSRLKFSSEIKNFDRDRNFRSGSNFFDRWALWVRGPATTHASKKGSEKVQGRVLGKGSQKVGHTPSTAGTFRKKFRKNSGKTPETLSELLLEFPSRARLGSPKPYNSRHLRLPEHFQSCHPPPVRLGAPLFSEVVPERASQSRSWNSQQYWGYF